MSKNKIIEISIVLAVICCLVYVRSYKLDADPPLQLSISSDVYTDTPNLTLYAKQNVKFGDYTPLGDSRFAMFEKSMITYAANIIFRIFGPSFMSSNIVGLLFSIGAMLIFYLLLRKFTSSLAGIFFLLFIGLNYNHIFYGRLAFQEHAMAFFGFLSLYLVLVSKNMFINILSGISLGLSIFFAKIIGVVFLFPAVAFFGYQLLYQKDSKAKKDFLLFLFGFFGLTCFWFFYSYWPSHSEVGSYVGEHVYSLYGFPKALISIDTFFNRFLSLGVMSLLINRMKIELFLGMIFIGLFFINFTRGKKEQSGEPKIINPFTLISTALIIGFYLFLMIWNYRPLRYQLVLIYPFSGAAAIICSLLWNKWKFIMKKKLSFKFYFIFWPLTAIPLFFLAHLIFHDASGAFDYDNNKLVFFIVSFSVNGIVFYLVNILRTKEIALKPILGKILVILLLGFTVTFNFDQYYYWAERATYTIRDNSRDLSVLLNRNAVLSGPYSSALTIENDYNSIIHMFGVSDPDPDFFKKQPITHLLMDNSNETKAFKDYPDLMDKATHILTYNVGLNKIRLYRIAGYTGNKQADSYQLSPFEQLVDKYKKDGILDNKMAVDILSRYPDNINCYTFLAEAAEIDGLYPLAESMFKKSVEFSPTNYDLTARLAKFYHDRFNETKNVEYKEKGLLYYDMAIWVAPNLVKLRESKLELEKSF